MAKLTDKQKRFIEEYLVDLNGAAAAIRAGYSPKSARDIASELQTKPHIRAHIDKAMAELSRRTGINQERVIRELAKLALVNPTDVINIDEATVKDDASRDDTAAILSVKVKTIPTEDGDITEREVKMTDKTRALELLGKHFGMFKDNLNLTGDVAVKIVDDIPHSGTRNNGADEK